MPRNRSSNANQASPKAATEVGETGLSAAVVQSRFLLLQIAGYLAAVTVIFVWFEKWKPLFIAYPVVAWGILLGPIFYLFVFGTAPRWWQRTRQARRNAIALKPNPALSSDVRYFRLDRYVMATPEEFHRDDKAHVHILEWIRSSSRPILFLSGVSGAGKSSVLEGYVLPMLEKDGVRVERIRSITDPLPQLETILATRRSKSRRLLIVFDQFEEFIILEDLTSTEVRRQFLDRIRVLRQSAPPGLCLLFAFRRDYMGDVVKMELDEVVGGKSFMEVDTFKRDAARRFFEKALSNSDLIAKLLAGAENLEDVPARIRPVTLNMLGIALQDFDGEVTRQPERLVQGYLETALLQPDIREIAPQVVVKMISNANTKMPCKVADLQTMTGLANQDIRACLILLERKGLVRLLDSTSGLWELSHDFVARQFAILLAKLRPNRWPVIVMSIMSGLFVIMLVWAAIGLPGYLAGQALTELARLKVGISGQVASFDPFITKPNATKAIPYLAQLDINTLNLKGLDLSTLPPLDKLTSLQKLDLSDSQVTSLPSLDKLTALQSLDLSNSQVKTLPSLDKLTALQMLNLSNSKLTVLPSLDNLTALIWLDLSLTQVTKLPSLDNLTALQTLDLPSTKLKELPSLDKLTALQSLNLSFSELPMLPSLDKLTALQTLDISDSKMKELPSLDKLTALKRLDLRGSKLTTLPALDKLTALHWLDLSRTTLTPPPSLDKRIEVKR